MQRERWDNRTAFILASIGSAIGLGNIWRFPFVCYENGGGAFLIAMLVALFTAGIPLLILEFSLGHKMQGSAPQSFFQVKKGFQWFGWFAALVGFGVVVYYLIIMSYAFNYTIASFTEAWGNDPNGFFYDKTLGLTDSPLTLGSFKPMLFLGLIVCWIWVVLSTWKGTKTVSKVVYVTVIVPWLLLVIFIIRGVTLPGAVEGLNYYLTPDFAKLADYKVWLAAYTQVFFSLSVGFGIMIAYGSFLPKKTDLVNNAFIVGLADSLTAFMGGLAVFGALGFHAHELGVKVADVAAGGPGLTFVTYPTIISNLPFWQPLFGVLFFIMLLTLGIDSAFSMTESVAASVKDRLNIKHRTANLSVGTVGFLLGIPMVFGAGYLWLDIVDRFMNQFGLMLVGLGEAILIGWYYGAKKIRTYANGISEMKVGRWWDICVKFILPVVAVVLLGAEILDRIKGAYGGYPRIAEFIGGWLVVILLLIMGVILAKISIKERRQ
ncbi:sodium-dependent transporter [Candidatus Zixiibacteriota bacterium]